MTDAPIKLFYSYAHADAPLRKRLEDHLALLRREGYISEWHDRMVSPGTIATQEIDAQLQAARIIVILVSASFLASDYCYGIELQEAMRKHYAGEARVIPIILRECDWQTAPFGQLSPLPRNAKPVMAWPNRDAAFADIARGMRAVIDELRGIIPHPDGKNDHDPGRGVTSRAPGSLAEPTRKPKGAKSGAETGSKHMLSAPALNTAILKKTVASYYKQLEDYKSKAESELSLRNAFQNLLAETARQVKWTLVAEQTIEKGIRPDGVVRDTFFARGYWEAKGPRGNLEQEITKKIAQGYPLTNTIFENTQRAVLYQNKRRFAEYNLQESNAVHDLIHQFFGYTEPDIENFETAVQEFKERIPELAKSVLAIIDKEYKTNKRFITAFDTFAELCRTSLDPKMTNDVLNEMLIQHLLTERLFRTIFANSDFVRRNVIASEIEKVIDALASRSFNRNDFLKSLDRFYVAIEAAAQGIDSWSERQHFLNTVYERFFQGYSIKRADTYGIVYTPQEIVDFMCSSVDEVLKSEFGKSIEEPGVQILDPATGTGSFIVNLMQNHISRHKLQYKYQHDLFCNEIMLLPYYISSLNIEHEYFEKVGEYEPFEGVCFVDTLELAEGRQLPLFVEENTERVQREKDAQVMVVIGNPPYNVGQKRENDNNKNRKYPVIDRKIYEEYIKDSKATNSRALGDAYIKFFRWATDRLQNHDGIICFVSNNSFLEGYAYDGFRKRLEEDFTHIYHLDLGGNARKQGGGNVFGIMLGVGITILIRHRKDTQPPHSPATIFYHKIINDQSGSAKLNFLAKSSSIENLEWQELHSDKNHNWINEDLRFEFNSSSFLPIGTKEAKAARIVEVGGVEVKTIFKLYSPGVQTNRDRWMYDFNKDGLITKANSMIETYNSEVSRWIRTVSSKDIDSFVLADETKIKWSSSLKESLVRKIETKFEIQAIRNAIYRPFTHQVLYFDSIMTHRQGIFPIIFPNTISETENKVICLTDLASEKPFMVLGTNTIADLHLVGAGAYTQCFPYYTYSPDGTNRQENITDWALTQFQARYTPTVTKWNIFHYVYAMLHHPQYRERYVENLKRDLPHIPLLHNGGGGTNGIFVCVSANSLWICISTTSRLNATSWNGSIITMCLLVIM